MSDLTPTQILVAVSLGAAGITGEHADRVWEVIKEASTRSSIGELAETVARAIAQETTPTDKETK